MAQEWHIGPAMFRRFLKGKVSRTEAQEIVAHLLHGCDDCAGLVQRIAAGDWNPAYEDSAVRGRATSFADEQIRRRAVELVEGWGSWALLEPLSRGERMARVLADPTLHTLGFYEHLLEAGRRYGRTNPAEGVEIVELALLVAGHLEPRSIGGQTIRQDVLAEGHAVLGNARRLASDFDGARSALNRAWKYVEAGSGDPFTQAYIVGLEASWMIDMGEFETAEAALQEALLLYRSVHDRHHEGRTLLQMAAAIGYVDPERGIAHIREALPLVDRRREPRLDLCAHHDLAWFLADTGKTEEALALLDDTRPLYRQFPDDWAQLRLHWLEGHIARALGKLEEAEHIFHQLWQEFRRRNLHHEFVLVSLELAETQVAHGAFETAARLAAEVYAVMAAWGRHRYALGAWLMLQNALDLQKTDDLLARLQRYFRRHWHRPAEFTETNGRDR
jgi:tetratricopeptide (TPR) repeat protein